MYMETRCVLHNSVIYFYLLDSIDHQSMKTQHFICILLNDSAGNSNIISPNEGTTLKNRWGRIKKKKGKAIP
jgi:hypothetical protein